MNFVFNAPLSPFAGGPQPMITKPIARALVAHLSALHHTTVVYPDDAAAVVARGALDALAHGLPVLRDVADAIAVRAQRVSVTFPTPLGTVVLVSPEADGDPEQLAVTGSHEHEHAVQIEGVGGVQAIVDHVEPELRARAEADAKATGLAVRWFLTGVVPALDDALASIAGETYHLGADHVALARGVLESHRATMEAGLCPPLRVALEVLAWLRANHPELVLATVAS